jgi:ornithine cyclodeaminase/alanine dehydrogenase-like protein (mu-crystallin family)
VLVRARSEVSTTEFCKRCQGEGDVAVSPGDPSKGDIVCLTTNASESLFDEAALNPGAHLNAIGAFRPDMRELDSATIARSLVFVDSIEAANRGAGDLIQAEQAGAWLWSELGGELSDLVLGRAKGRSSPDQVTVFKSVGLAVQDAAAAAIVYARAVETRLGERLG